MSQYGGSCIVWQSVVLVADMITGWWNLLTNGAWWSSPPLTFVSKPFLRKNISPQPPPPIIFQLRNCLHLFWLVLETWESKIQMWIHWGTWKSLYWQAWVGPCPYETTLWAVCLAGKGLLNFYWSGSTVNIIYFLIVVVV